MPAQMQQMAVKTRVVGPTNVGNIVSHLTRLDGSTPNTIAELRLTIYEGSEDNIIGFLEHFTQQLRQLMKKPHIATARDMMEAITKGGRNDGGIGS